MYPQTGTIGVGRYPGSTAATTAPTAGS